MLTKNKWIFWVGIVGVVLVGLFLIYGFGQKGSYEKMTEPDSYADIGQMTGYIDVSAMDAMELISSTPELIIIDVSPSYEKGHIPGAVNYYVGDGSLDTAIPSLDSNAIYLVYCHVDSASISGAKKLVDAGFENVYRLEGNYAAWVDAGYDVEI